MASAKTIATAMVATTTTGQGGWPMRTIAYAPTMISSPWAKLISRMIPKISAIPSAKSANWDPR